MRVGDKSLVRYPMEQSHGDLEAPSMVERGVTLGFVLLHPPEHRLQRVSDRPPRLAKLTAGSAVDVGR